MSLNRRDFLRAGVSAGALAASPGWLRALDASTWPRPAEALPITDTVVRELAFRAVEAARTAGAAYADVRLTHTRAMDGDAETEEAFRDIGVRALVDGYWGFSAGALWTADQVARLGREAVHQAKVNALGKQRVVELGQASVIHDGHWAHPVERDPFEVPAGEILDFKRSLDHFVRRKSRVAAVRDGFGASFGCVFRRQDKAFASSEGSYCTQRLYRTTGRLSAGGGDQNLQLQLSSPIIDGACRGWEYIAQAPLREEIERLFDDILADMALPAKPVEVGRYDVVFDAQSMATLLAETLGGATDLSRALGYLAHEPGASYLADPLSMLGSYQAGSPLLNVMADRALEGGLATVKWDDEGMEPDRFALIEDGILVDFQTHREGAGWLGPAYAKQGRPIRSHGCAAAERAFEPPAVAMPNLTLAPAAEGADFDELVGSLKQGLAVKQLGINMDWQCLNGAGRVGPTSRVYQVKDGKRVARIEGAEFLIRAPEFWKALQRLGGAASQRPFAHSRSTVTAPPAMVKQVTTIRAGARA